MGGKGHATRKEGHTHDLAEGKSCQAQQNASLLSQIVILKLGKRMQLVLLAFSIFSSWGYGFYKVFAMSITSVERGTEDKGGATS